jgi:putative addiction module killer protein
MRYQFVKTIEYEEWLVGETRKSLVQIAKRLSNIETDGFFGKNRYLDDFLWELKWENGRRIYYAIIPPNNIVLLLGGNKNGQSKDIAQAKKILKTYHGF